MTGVVVGARRDAEVGDDRGGADRLPAARGVGDVTGEVGSGESSWHGSGSIQDSGLDCDVTVGRSVLGLEALADDLVDGPFDVSTSEDLIEGVFVEVDGGILLDNLPVELVEDVLDVGGDVAEFGLVTVELLTLDFQDLGVAGRNWHTKSKPQ